MTPKWHTVFSEHAHVPMRKYEKRAFKAQHVEASSAVKEFYHSEPSQVSSNPVQAMTALVTARCAAAAHEMTAALRLILGVMRFKNGRQLRHAM